MKKVVLFLSFAVLCSCSVQKRKYQKGFYVSWKHKQESVSSSKQSVVCSKQEPLGSTQQENVFASANNKAEILNIQSKKISLDENDSCDVILFKDGKEIKAKVFEIVTDEIKYKRCDMPTGPLYVAKKSEIFMVKYANGMSEVFKNEPSTVASNRNANNYPSNGNTSAKPQTSALAIISLIFGILGIWPLPLVGSIVAIVCGSIALKQIRNSPNQYKGEGLARAGLIMGWIIVGLSLLILLIVILALFL